MKGLKHTIDAPGAIEVKRVYVWSESHFSACKSETEKNTPKTSLYLVMKIYSPVTTKLNYINVNIYYIFIRINPIIILGLDPY